LVYGDGVDCTISISCFDGTLSVIEQHVSGRDQIGDFLGGNELLISPNGNNVYATGTRSSTLAGFSRDPDSGVCILSKPSRSAVTNSAPAGLAISGNGKYVYVAVEGDRGIAVFRREQAQ
jgi:6-phosphogluconolactonase (cycloisomerase 2 family)